MDFCYSLLCFFFIYFCSNFNDFFPSTNPGFLLLFLVALSVKLMLFMWFFCCFLRQSCIAMNLPLSAAFTESHRFWVVVFSFSFVSMHILISFFISSVICWLFRGVLFSLHMLEFLVVLSCSWHLILLHCDHERCLELFQFFLNLPRLDLWPRMWSILEKVPWSCSFLTFLSLHGIEES